MTLAHVPIADIDYVNTNLRRGTAKMLVGLLDPSNQLLENPRVIGAGLIQSNNVEIQENFAVVSVLVRSSLGNFSRASNTRYTDEGQQLKVPGDRGFKFVGSLAQLQIHWGDQNA